jgi:hypothetical protein
METEIKGNNTMADEDRERSPSPPYISFLTFFNFITWLESEGIPLRLDRSFWNKKYSGSTGFQLMTSLRFLGLLKGDKPEPELEELVIAKGEDRQRILEKILKKSYALINFDALARATPAMLTEWFRNYGLDGHTLRKAESFFINACKSTNIQLSNALRKKSRNKPTKSARATKEKKRVAGREKVVLQQAARQPQQFSTELQGQVNRVMLNSGGEVTLAVNVNLFELSTKDRVFVLKLIDIMKGYEESAGEVESEVAPEDLPF